MSHTTRLRAATGRVERLESLVRPKGRPIWVIFPPGATEDEIERLRLEAESKARGPITAVLYIPDNGRLEDE